MKPISRLAAASVLFTASAQPSSAQIFPDANAAVDFVAGVQTGIADYPSYEIRKLGLEKFKECLKKDYDAEAVRIYKEQFRFGLSALNAANKNIIGSERFIFSMQPRSASIGNSVLSIIVKYGVDIDGIVPVPNEKSLTIDIVKGTDSKGKTLYQPALLDFSVGSVADDGRTVYRSTVPSVNLTSDGRGFAKFIGQWATRVAPEQTAALKNVSRLDNAMINIYSADCKQLAPK